MKEVNISARKNILYWLITLIILFPNTIFAQNIDNCLVEKESIYSSSFHIIRPQTQDLEKRMKNDLMEVKTLNLSDSILDKGHEQMSIKEMANYFNELGVWSYNHLPSETKYFLQKAAFYFKLSEDPINMNLGLQNMAFWFEEKEGNIDSAVYYASIAYFNWVHSNDTMNIANMQKYLGHLIGIKGNFNCSLNLLDQAIELYEKMNNNQAVGTCYFNKGTVYKSNKLYHDSEMDFLKAKNIFIEENAPYRIFLVNNQLLDLCFYNKKDPSRLISENEAILKQIKVNEQGKNSFFDILKKFNQDNFESAKFKE